MIFEQCDQKLYDIQNNNDLFLSKAFTVLILSKEHKEEELKDCLYENKEINLKVDIKIKIQKKFT